MGCGVSKKLSVRYLPGIMIVNFYTHRRLWLFSNGMFWGDLFHWNRLEWMNGMNRKVTRIILLSGYYIIDALCM